MIQIKYRNSKEIKYDICELDSTFHAALCYIIASGEVRRKFYALFGLISNMYETHIDSESWKRVKIR